MTTQPKSTSLSPAPRAPAARARRAQKSGAQKSGAQPALFSIGGGRPAPGSSGTGQLGDFGDFFGVGHSCPLDIKVTEGDTSRTSPFDMKSGVSLINGSVNQIGFKKDADFAGGATFKGQCVSGCVDLLATVTGGEVTTDSNGVSAGQRLGDVSLTATVVGISNDDEIVNPKAGNGDVCAASSFGSEAASVLPCDTTISTTTSTAGATGYLAKQVFGPGHEFDDQLKALLQNYGVSQKPGSLATVGAARISHS